MLRMEMASKTVSLPSPFEKSPGALLVGTTTHLANLPLTSYKAMSLSNHAKLWLFAHTPNVLIIFLGTRFILPIPTSRPSHRQQCQSPNI